MAKDEDRRWMPSRDVRENDTESHLPDDLSKSKEQPSDDKKSEMPLFETYEPRTSQRIIQQREQLRESEAAEAAAIILEDVEPLELDCTDVHLPQRPADPKARQLLDRANREALRRQHNNQGSTLRLLYAPGAQFVYALLIIAALGGIIGLAATIESPTLILIAGIASPILLPICIWKWIRWLDSTPYYYRLLTSLGEDARNLLNYRLFWRRN